MTALTANHVAGKLIPAVPVPFDNSGRIHQGALDSYVSWMVRQPIGGVAVWAHTGRGLFLSPTLRDAVLRTWRSSLPSGSFLVAAAGSPPVERSPAALFDNAYAMACRAAELGANALLVHPPAPLRDHPGLDSLVIRYHEQIARAGLPVVLFYLYQQAGGISYSSEVLAELLAHPQVLGIKIATLDSVITFQDIAQLVALKAPGKAVITGEDRFLPYSLMCGTSLRSSAWQQPAPPSRPTCCEHILSANRKSSSS